MAKDLRNPRLYTTTLVAALLAAMGALATVAFIRVLEGLTDLVWTRVPGWLGVDSKAWYFILPACLIGGAGVGVARHFLGEWPRSLEESMEVYKEEKVFDYTHLGQALAISLVGLVFGASLGPEAALTALVGGLCSWMAGLIKASAQGRDTLTYLGLVGSLGALFGTAGAAALPMDDPESEKPSRLWLVVPGVVAAFVGAEVFKRLSGSGGYLHFTYPDYTFAAIDIVKALLPMLAGAAAAIMLLAVARATDALFVKVPNRVVQSTLGGLGLAVLGVITYYSLFSGHEGIQELIDDPQASAGFLLAVGLIKVLAICICLSSGWKGGRFFPIMFVGTAIGLAVSAGVTAIPSTVGLCAAMTAAVAALLRKPLPAVILMLFLFPFSLYPIVIVTGILAGLIGKQVVARVPALDPMASADDAQPAPEAPLPPEPPE